MAPETYKGKFIAALWDIFLTIGSWAELVGDDRWPLPTANNLRNNILARWAWEDRSAPDNVEPRHLAWWLGQKAGVTPDRARNLLEPYTRRRERNVYFSHTTQEAHNETLSRQARKTILVTVGAPRNPTGTVEHSSTAPSTSGGLATRLSNMLAPVNAGAVVHDPTLDAEPMAAPLVPPVSTSTPMDVDEAPASPSSRDSGMKMPNIYLDNTP